VTSLKDKPFALIGVHVGGTTAEQLKKITEKNELPWRSFSDAGTAGAGPIAKQWNLSATPTLYVIDHKGVIRYKWSGVPGEKVIDAALNDLIRAAEGKGSPP
jgi:peroxiredoxin